MPMKIRSRDKRGHTGRKAVPTAPPSAAATAAAVMAPGEAVTPSEAEAEGQAGVDQGRADRVADQDATSEV